MSIFVKGFYVHQSGYIEELWINPSLCKSIRKTDFFDNRISKTVTNVLKCDLGTVAEAYIDGNKPIEVKGITEIFTMICNTSNKISEDRPAKRGRPLKVNLSAGEDINY